MNYTLTSHYVFMGGILAIVMCSAGIFSYYGSRWEKTKKYTYAGFFLCHAIGLLPVVLLPWIHTFAFPLLAAIICVVPFFPGMLYCNYHSDLFSHDPILFRGLLRPVTAFVSAALPIISLIILLNAGSTTAVGYATPLRWILGLIMLTASGYVLLTLVMLYNQWCMESFFSIVTPQAIQTYFILACLFLGAWLISLIGLFTYQAFLYIGLAALIVIPIVHLFITLRLIKAGDLYLSVTIPPGMNSPLIAPKASLQEYNASGFHTLEDEDAYLMEEFALSQIATDIVRKSKRINRQRYKIEHTETTQRQPEKKRSPELSPAIDAQDLRDGLLGKLRDEKVYLDENITITTLANDLNIEPYQLSRFINYHLNTRFNTLINTWRIKEAQQLLAEEPEQTVLDIAFAVGFNSKASFNRVFKDMTGMTPTAYREKTWAKKP
jgi:AraC-like DNA-binding protein